MALRLPSPPWAATGRSSSSPGALDRSRRQPRSLPGRGRRLRSRAWLHAANDGTAADFPLGKRAIGAPARGSGWPPLWPASVGADDLLIDLRFAQLGVR